MESIEELIKQSRGVLGLLERCQPFLQSSKSRSEYCEDSAKPMRRSIDILEEIKKKKFVINIAFFSTKPGVGKSFIINALTTNQSGAPATSSSQMGGNGVTSIPTRYRYGKTKRYTRYYLDKEQIEERISLYRKYHSELDLSYQEKYSSGPLQQDLTSDLLDSEDFFLQVQNIQKKTSHTDQFFTLYDEVIYPFPLMEEADMKYSLLDLPGYRDGKSEFRFCQLYACLKYCDIHTVAGIAYGTAGRGRPEPADLQLLLALHCFESQFTATPHPPNYMHLLNTINNNEDDYNEERLKELINDALVDVFGLATQQTEKVNSNDIDEIATRANRNLAALENRYSLYQNILEHSMAHVFYKVDNAPNADHVERWNNSVISDIKGYVAETQQQILCHQALVILSELSVPLKYRVKTGNTSLEKKMKARMKHFTNLVILQKKGITGKLKEIMDSSKDEYDTETGDDTAAFNTLYNLITHLMVDITESLAKDIRSNGSNKFQQSKEFIENHYLSEECITKLKNYVMSGKPISDPATSVLYIQHAITQLMDYVQREYRAWLDSEEFGNNSPRFLEIECNNVKIREKCQKLLDDFIDRMRDLHPYNVNTESEENADRLSEILKELRNYFREKLKIRNSLIQAERKDEEIKITTHPLPTPKRFNGRYVIPEGDNYAKLEDCKKFVQIFKHNTFATLQRRERKVIPVIPEIPNKWFNELPADVKGSTIILTCNKNYRHKKCIGITFADTSLNDNKLRPFREVPKNGQNILKNIPPVFIPTYPRQAQGESSSQIEEIIPHIEYLENLRSLNTSIKEQEIEQITFLVFEDDKEHNRLKNYHRKYGNIPNVYFLVLEHDIFNLNTVCNMGIGRKRTFIQVAAEYFKFPFFAVIDDDIGRYEEFSPKHHQNIFDEYTTFRSLAFLRKSLLTEMFPLNNEELKRFKLLLSSEVLKFALSSGLSEEEMECKSEQISAKIVSYVEGMQADAETRPVIAWEMLKYLSIDPEIASLASSKEKTLLSALKKKFNLFKSCDHIGTAALVNRASTAYATLYRRLQNFQKTTHYISSMIYQCVMYHTDAIKGLYHVDQDVFFNEECLSHQDRAQLMKQTKGPDDANGQALMKLGYKHEDKYHHRQLLLHGVTGFQVYWYNIENNKEESLVNGNANSYSLVHGQAIEATTNGHSNAKSQTTVPGQSTARSETSGLGENADSRKRKRRESNDEAQ